MLLSDEGLLEWVVSLPEDADDWTHEDAVVFLEALSSDHEPAFWIAYDLFVSMWPELPDRDSVTFAEAQQAVRAIKDRVREEVRARESR